MAEEEQQDFSKLDIDDLIKHKNWKARVTGFDKLIKELGQHEPEDAIFKQTAPNVKNFVQDSNPSAHERGLDAARTFIDLAPSSMVGKICADVVAGIVAKCLPARPKTKEKGIEIIFLYFELEKQEPTLEELIKGLSNKSPKVVSGCMTVIRDALKLYGPKIVTLKTIIKNIPPFLEDRDKSVREETRVLLVEIYRWIGEALKPQLQGVSPQQMNELDAEFGKNKGVKAVPEKLVRSEQAKKAAAPAETDASSAPTEAEEETEAAAEENKLDNVDPQEVLKSLPEDFDTKLQSKKWQERKEALDAFDKLSTHPKLAEGDYGPVVSELKKIIGKDSNVSVVAVAGKCIANLGKGLQQKFSPYSPSCISVILEKFKEKKSNVVTAMRDAVDACFLSTTLDVIAETILEDLSHKTPSVKSETTTFLTRCFCKFHPEDLPKKQLKIFVEALIKNSNDPDQSVRDSAFEALGTAMKVVGEKAITPFLTDGIDELKMKKIQEFCEKAVITAPKRKKPVAAPAKTNAPPANKTETSAKSGAAVKKVVRPGPSKSAAAPKPASSDPEINEAVDVKGGGDSVGSQSSQASAAAKGKAVAVKKAVPAAKPKAALKEEETGPVIILNPKGKQQRSNDEKVLKVLKWSFTAPSKELIQQLMDQMVPCFSPNLQKWLFSDDFKNHIKAIDALQADLNLGTENTLSVLDLILKWFSLRFFDTNPTVLMKAMDYLISLFRKLAEQDYKLSDFEASSFIPYLLLKSGEPKEPIREKVRAVVRQLCGLYPYPKIYAYLADGMKSKNARQRSECVDLATTLVEADGMDVHGPNVPSHQAALKLVASLIGDKDAAVRNAALNNLLVVYQLVGEKIFKLIGQINEKDRSMLDERIKRAPKKLPPQKTESVDRVESRTEPRMTKTQSMPVAATLADDAYSDGMQDDPRMSVTSPGTASVKASGSESKLTTSPEKLDSDRPSTVTLRRTSPLQLKPISEASIKVATSSISIPAPSESMLGARKTTGGSMSTLFSDMMGNNAEKSLAALKKIDDILHKNPSDPMIADNILGLHRNLIDLLTRMHNHAMSNYATNADYITSCYTHIFHIIRAIFENQKYADLADAGILSAFLYQILPVLLDKRMERMKGGQAIVSLANVIVLRIVDNANRTQILCASIRLLRDLLGSGMLTDKILDVGIKVVWRCVRRMPDTMLQLELDPVLLEVHLFLKQFPTSHWQTASNDTPFRSIKTIVYSLTKMFGTKVLDHLKLVDDPQNSELVSFLKRVLNSVERSAGNPVTGDGNVPNGIPMANGNGIKVHEDKLSNIMERVGSSNNETVQQGLRELYEYKEAHKISLDGFLERTSAEFQKFVHDGLRMIEFEEKALGLPGSGLSEKGQGVINRFRGALSSPYMTAQDVENIRQTAEELKLQVRNRCFETVEERVQTALREADINMINAESSSTASQMPANVLSPSRPLKVSDENSPSSRPSNNLDAVRARVNAFLQKKNTN
ncbi:cytoskeleton-associated protein 5-like [Paramacrobiotus metropolitanus]|uniref:cytoskeleton-associated protein 5-like n=1 Tax=Paramacrobiotus metropolitanus TaxID=2943436 RepID=UPI00244610C7|nr:cytoskeleton-associated protein 5-like [Paramacrobiotus metropolitanus]